MELIKAYSVAHLTEYIEKYKYTFDLLYKLDKKIWKLSFHPYKERQYCEHVRLRNELRKDMGESNHQFLDNLYWLYVAMERKSLLPKEAQHS
jgi:hypothetical protein